MTTTVTIYRRMSVLMLKHISPDDVEAYTRFFDYDGGGVGELLGMGERGTARVDVVVSDEPIPEGRRLMSTGEQFGVSQETFHTYSVPGTPDLLDFCNVWLVMLFNTVPDTIYYKILCNTP